MTHEFYASIDIEADGPCPGLNSMLSLGVAIMDPRKAPAERVIAAQDFNLNLIPGAEPDSDTMRWWQQHKEQYEFTRTNMLAPTLAMKQFTGFVKQHTGNSPVIPVAYPSGFDFTFLYYYLHRFAGNSIFQRSCIDMRSYAMGKLGMSFTNCAKHTFPKEWFDFSAKHTHRAKDDAIEQGLLFCNMFNYSPCTATVHNTIDLAIKRLSELKSSK